MQTQSREGAKDAATQPAGGASIPAAAEDAKEDPMKGLLESLKKDQEKKP
jgi:hypothetical protein